MVEQKIGTAKREGCIVILGELVAPQENYRRVLHQGNVVKVHVVFSFGTEKEETKIFNIVK